MSNVSIHGFGDSGEAGRTRSLDEVLKEIGVANTPKTAQHWKGLTVLVCGVLAALTAA